MTADELNDLIAAARRIVRAFEIFPLPGLIEPGDVLPVARGLLALIDTGPDADARGVARLMHAKPAPTVARLADPLTARYERIRAEFAAGAAGGSAAQAAAADIARHKPAWTYPAMDWRPAVPAPADQTDTVSVCPPPKFDGSTWAGEPRRAGRANDRIPNSGDGSP